jgi:hypothetical protein
MTTRENHKEKMNKFDEIPSAKAIEVVIAQTTAEWLDGIPPVRQKVITTSSLGFPLRPPSRNIKVFRSWAMHKLDAVDKNTGLTNRALRESDLSEIASGIV